jgi:hypothetical protein
MRSEERASAALLACVSLLVPLVWLGLGWRPDRLVGANDLSLLVLPAIQRLLAVGGDFDAFLYDPSWLGGSKLRDLFGALPIHRILAALPLDGITLLNISAFFAQTLYGFLAARSARALAQLLAPDRTPGLVALILVALCAAFAPLVGFRIGYGHLYILFGALALPAATALLLLARTGRLTLTCTVVAVLAFAHALPHVGLQPVVYGMIFGVPLLAGVLFGVGAPRATWLRSTFPALLAALGALGLSLPVLAGLMRHFASGDAPRGFGGAPVTYSYLVATGRDWLGSLALGLDAAQSAREAFTLHETNYPLGPVLLGLLVFPRRLRGLALGALVSVALVLAFSMNAQPLSTLLLALPPLQMFRIPARAALPLGLALLPLLLALPLARLPARIAKTDAALLLAGLALCLVDGLVRESLLWLTLLGALVVALRPQWERFRPSAPALLGVLFVASTLAFAERLLPFPTREALLETPAALGARVTAQIPELQSPLVRMAMEPELAPNNRLYGMGLSSLSGYNLLNERFLRLYCALLGVPYQPSISLVALDPGAPWFPKVAALYDIRARFARNGRATTLARVSAGGAPAWLGRDLVPYPTHDALVRALDPETLLAHVAYVRTDTATRDLPAIACDAPTRALDPGTGPGPTLVRVPLPGARRGLCPLVFSMNYTRDMEAVAERGTSRTPLRTFPAYGALLGVLVPADATAVEIRLEPHRPAWSLAGAALGALALLALLRVQRSQA